MNKYLFAILVSIALLPTCKICALTPSASESIVYQKDDDDFVKGRLESVQKYIDNGDFTSAEKLLNALLEDYPNNFYIKEWQANRERIVAKENEAYETACSADTKEALQDFISQYPNSEYALMAKDKISDYDLWQQARVANTIEAYKHYLSTSSLLAFKDEANAYINTLQEEQDWIRCKDSNDITLLNQFISNYPQSQQIDEAEYLLNILKGQDYYKGGYENLAYNLLSKANDYRTLMGEPANTLMLLKEKRGYDKIITSNDKAEVRRYLDALSTSSIYYKDVSNHYALLLAKDLVTSSTDYQYNQARSYATDSQTKRTVETYIENVKKKRAYYDHQRKAAARKRWWKDRFKVGWNAHVDFLSETMSIGTGVKFRFGRWSDVFNFLFGAEYSYVMWMPKDSDRSDETYSLGHQIEVPITIRFNLFKTFSRTKFYIGCAGVFGFKIADGDAFYMSSTSIAFQPELGFVNNHWDLGFYYRKYLNDYNIAYSSRYDFEDQRVGCFFTWFF